MADRTDARVWVVAGAPGAGKSTTADVLRRLLVPPPALLDKDTLFDGLEGEVLAAAGRRDDEREGAWYDEHVKRHEYAALAAAARDMRAGGCSVVLVAPFTTQIRDSGRWQAWVEELGGPPVHLVWTRIDPEALRTRLRGRGRAKDAGKLRDYDAFVDRMRPSTPPPVPHIAVDTSGGAPPAEFQLAPHLAVDTSGGAAPAEFQLAPHLAVDTSDGAAPAEFQLAPHIAVDTSGGAPPLHAQLHGRLGPDQREDGTSSAP